jgi:hypothetical protein
MIAKRLGQVVDEFAKLLSCPEGRNSLGRQLEAGTRFRIARNPRLPFTRGEGTEATKSTRSQLQGANDSAEDGLDDGLSVFAAHTDDKPDFFDQFRSCEDLACA